jgi:TPR repeat protein
VRLALIESRRALVNEPVPLGVTLTGALDEGAVIVSGLAAGARLSTGAALGAGSWRVPVADLAQAAVGPPRDFIGAMDLAVELRSADDSVTDRSTMRIEWAPASAALPGQAQVRPEQGLRPAGPPAQSGNVTLDREKIATLVKRGQDFIANGDLASARLVLRRAADGGDAQAALLLGSTYDPARFKQLKVIGSAPDPAQARAWYQRAADLGSAEAVRLFEPLAQGAR